MTLKTSLIITGDSKVAQQAVDDLKKSIDGLGTGSRTAANSQGALSTSSNAVAGAARNAAAAQGAVAAANTTVAATGRAAAAAQGAVAAASTAATGAMAAFGVSALTVEAILTGGLSLAITAVIGFLTGFAGELFSAGNAADDASIKTDRYATSIDNLRKAQGRVTAEDLGNAKVRLEQLQGQLRTFDKRAGPTDGTRANVQRGPAVSAQRAALEEKIEDTRRIVNASTMRRDNQLALDAMAEAEKKGKKDASAAAKSAREAASAAKKERADAAREAAKDAREGAAAQKKLQADLEGAVTLYDPARKAASEYADELERIKGLASAGKITADGAANYRAQASANYLGSAINIDGLKDLGEIETKTATARGAIDKLVASIEAEAAAVGKLNPVEKEMLGYRKELAALPEGERAAAEARLRAAAEAKIVTEETAEATKDAARAQAQLQGAAVDAFAEIVVGGQKASDVVNRLAQSIASAAIEATLFGTGPMAALLNGSLAKGVPTQTIYNGDASGGVDLVGQTVGKSVGKEIKETMDGIFGGNGSFGKTLRNAGLGYAAGGLTGSRTGGAIGGAIGGKVGEELLGTALGSLGKFAGPLGAIAGGLLGGAIGGLLKKTKTGAATITSVDGDARLSGNNSGFQKAAGGAAGSVQEGLSSIAEQFGGSTGAFNVTIGQRDGDWRVRTGAGSLKVKKGAKDFDDDQAGAIAYAMQLAISQGAVTGLSAAVQKAINSSPDLDKALEEALKVQEIETLVGGIGSVMERQFRDLERQAKERLRIASQYGFDTVAIEQKNAADRLALTEEMVAAQVGSLQRLVTEMTSGSMFEGSAIDQRTALLAEVEKAKADLDAGKDGAGDRLANLYSQLNSVSRDAYGTTGQFAADNNMILDEARAAIARSNAQITAAAAKASDPALTATNQALDENNDQNAEVIALLKGLPANIAAIIAGKVASGAIDVASLARTA